eukprot:scaffold4341_cov91-Cylindrotheca_fusiformis.AAC.2
MSRTEVSSLPSKGAHNKNSGIDDRFGAPKTAYIIERAIASIVTPTRALFHKSPATVASNTPLHQSYWSRNKKAAICVERT